MSSQGLYDNPDNLYDVEKPTREQLIAELQEALQELNAIEAGLAQARPLADLLNEL